MAKKVGGHGGMDFIMDWRTDRLSAEMDCRLIRMFMMVHSGVL